MKPKYTHLTPAPFCASHLSVNEMIKVLLLCLLPHIIMLIVTMSLESLRLLSFTILAAVFSELLYKATHKHSISLSWSTILQGTIIGLLIPTGYLPVIAFIITFTILFFEKVIFMNFAQSWINTIALIMIVLYFVAPSFFPDYLIAPENLQQHNIGMKLFSDGILSISRFDVRITTLLNTAFFNTLGISVPEGYITLFWDSGSTIPAFRFNVLTIIASMVLFLTKTIDFTLPAIFLFVYTALVYAFSLYPYAEVIGNGDILLALFTSGTLFSAFFLIGWFGTTPLTLVGKIIHGIIAGFLAFLFCGAGTASIAIFFVIIVLNVLCPIILQIETVCYVSKMKKVFATAKDSRG